MAFSPQRHPRDPNGKFRRAGLRTQPTRSGPTGSTFVRGKATGGARAVSRATPAKYTAPSSSGSREKAGTIYRNGQRVYH